MTKREQFFIRSAGFLLMFTGIAKLVSALGKAGFLLEHEPITGISFTHLLVVAGILEVLIAFVCFFATRPKLSAQLVAWVSSVFLVYRIGLWWMNWQRPCHCLGNLTDALHISPQVADIGMKIVLAYLLIGSYATLFSAWWHKPQIALASATTPSSGA
jgi:hypothetical protein